MYYEHKELGYNYRMGPINAAVGLSKIDRLESEISQRRRCFEVYNQALGIQGFHFQIESPGHFSNRWLSTVCLRNKSEVEVLSKILDDHGIETRRVWKPMHQQPVFKDSPYYGSGVSDKLFDDGLCLPSGSNLSPADLERITALIKQQFLM